MRKLLVLLALAASSAFCLGAGATPALAGNCTQSSITPITYDGSWYYTATLGGCTGVSGAHFYGTSGVGAGDTYMFDTLRQTEHPTYSPTGTFLNTANAYAYTFHFTVWGQGCGVAPFFVNKFAAFDIRSVGGWGPLHQMGPYQQLLC